MTVSTHSRGGYVRGCRCAVCIEAHRAYQRAWSAEHYEHRMIEAAPYRIVVLAVWRFTRKPLCWIAAQAHVDVDTLRRLIDGRSEHIWLRTAVAIRSLTVWLPEGEVQSQTNS